MGAGLFSSFSKSLCTREILGSSYWIIFLQQTQQIRGSWSVMVMQCKVPRATMIRNNKYLICCWPADICGSDDDAPVGSSQRIVLHFVSHVVNIQSVCRQQLSVAFPHWHKDITSSQINFHIFFSSTLASVLCCIYQQLNYLKLQVWFHVTWNFYSLRTNEIIQGLTVMRGVDDVIPRKRHHNVMYGVTLSFLCRQHACCGFMNIPETR